MRPNLNLFAAILLISSLFSCSSDSSDDLTPPPDNEISYTNNIQAIIDGRCISCHANPPTDGAPFSLTTYAEVKDQTQNGALLNRIERNQGSVGVMPPSGSTLSASQIQTIKNWMAEGYKE